MTTDRVRHQLHRWCEELIDLSRRNRLVHFRPTKSSTLEILRPGPVAVLARLPESGKLGWRFYLPPDPEPEREEARLGERISQPPPPPHSDELVTSKETRQEIEGALRLLQRKANQEFVDKGLWVLYLGVGILQWIDSETEDRVESPIVLVPVKLERTNPRVPFQLLRAEEEVVVNPALAVKLGKMGLSLSTLDADELEETGIDGLLERVRHAVRTQADWAVSPRIVLSTFSFHKEVMYRDLLDNEELVAEHPMVEVLALGPETNVDFTFEPVPEEKLDEYDGGPEELVSIIDADSTQRQSIIASREGQTFVMDGPPGTGKSQTISNIIAELIAQEKTILFVSEKAAALDVVHKRLEAAGLGEYLLELHSHKATRKEVAQELGRALMTHPRAGRKLPATEVKRLKERRRELSEYAQAMNEARPELAKSLHEILGRAAALHDLPRGPVPSTIEKDLTADRLDSIMRLASDLTNAWGPVERGDDFLWRDLAATDWDATKMSEVAVQLEELADALQRLQGVHMEVVDELELPLRGSVEEARNIADLLDHLRHRPASSKATWLTAESIEPVLRRIDELVRATEDHRRIVRSLAEVVGPRWRELNPRDRERSRALIETFQGSSIPWNLPDSVDARHAAALARFLEDTGELADAALSDIPTIGSAFRLTTTGISLDRSAEIAELGALGATPIRPEASWLQPEVLRAVDAAAHMLGELVADFRRRRDGLSEVFTDGILTLDLQGLCSRFEQTHRGFRKLGRKYREDKRLVRQHTLNRKVDREVRRRLQDALQWQQVARSLNEAERSRASVLGGTYYRGMQTDFAQLLSAVGVARRALEIAGRELNSLALEQQIALGRAPEIDVVGRAETLHRRLIVWKERARSLLGNQTDALMAPLQDVASWARGLSGPADALAELLQRASATAGRDLDLGTIRRVVEDRARVHDLEDHVATERSTDGQMLGSRYDGIETDWTSLTEDVAWVVRVREIVGGGLDAESARALMDSDLVADALRETLGVWDKRLNAVGESFTESRAEELRRDLEVSHRDGAELIGHLRSSLADVDEWSAFVRATEELSQSGLEPVVSFCVDHRVDRGSVTGVVERSLLEACIDAIIRSDGRLRRFRQEDRDQILTEFRQLDRKLVQSAASRVIDAANARRPRTAVGEPGVIQQQSQLKRKHMPVRLLLERAGNAAKDLKPCFMMSPLTVSQFLPPTMRFDCVIFDEASQVRPSDAINCVYRGTQLIVAGDQKQLPPTSFFEKLDLDGEDEYEEGQFDEYESVLDLAKSAGAISSLPLRWHYRSQHESLITYSNYSFYDGRLVTFPGRTNTAPDVGVELFKVDGVYRRGGPRDNPIEAQQVVERILFHAERHPHLSVGVVTFSEAQAGAIEDQLERRRRDRPDLDAFFEGDRLTGFFVKSLENVQGDERDIIIFSVGYGYDEVGKFTLNFGPLNRDKGWRRLNVAITRAKRRVEIVSSVTAADIKGDIRSEGVRHLKGYLDFAERGIAALAMDLKDSQGDVESPFEEGVLHVIRSWGFDAVPQVGTAGYRIDIGVRSPGDPSRFVLGIECDGVMYHSSAAARDRDRLRQEVLERLGWKLHRIWGVAWHRDREGEERRLREAIHAAMDGEGRHKALTPSSSREETELVEIDLDQYPDWTVQYQVSRPRLGARFRHVPMYDPMALPEIERMIREVADTEGPVSEEVVLSRIRDAWGAGRAGARMRDGFEAALKRLRRRGDIDSTRGFLTLKGQGVNAVRVPDDADVDTFRKVDEVPDSELELAIRSVVSDARSITQEELTRHVARLFGWQRRGSDITQRLGRAVERMIRSGQLRRSGDRIQLQPA